MTIRSITRQASPSNARLESLESRRLLANYGNPWPEGSRLTLSFAPDSTPLAQLPSQLMASLDAALPRATWQAQIARALQKWAIHTDINIGHRSDNAATFGATGFTMGDPRFGDIRIGAHEMTSDVLAVSVPYDPARAGTLTGDIFLNTYYNFDGAPYDLMTVMLHEAGHVFGLDHSTDPASPMFARFNNPVSELTAGDIAAIRNLYGNRAPDRFDLTSANDTLGDASSIPTPNNFLGDTPLAAFGDLTTVGDVDFLKFQAPSDDNGYTGPITIQLRSAGISLARPELTVFDSAGVPIGSVSSTSFLGDTLTFTFNAQSDDTEFFIRVDSPATDEFAIGRYAVAVSFDARNVVPQANIDSVLLGPHESVDPQTLRQLFLNATTVYLNPDQSTNNTPSSASPLAPARPGAYEIIGSIERPGDIDFYTIVSPDTFTPVLTLNLWTVDPRGLIPSMSIHGSTARIIANGNRAVTLQLDNVQPSTPITIRVAGDLMGNYFLDIDRAVPVSTLQTFASGSSQVGNIARVDTLYVGESQLMHLLLSVNAHVDPTATLFMQIINEAGNAVFNLWARQGQSASAASVFLTSGIYRVRYLTLGTAVMRPDTTRTVSPDRQPASIQDSSRPSHRPTALAATPTTLQPLLPIRLIYQRPVLSFTLTGSTLSGPIGPSIRNPLLRPRFVHPTLPNHFLYPSGSTTDRFRWVTVVV